MTPASGLVESDIWAWLWKGAVVLILTLLGWDVKDAKKALFQIPGLVKELEAVQKSLEDLKERIRDLEREGRK